MLKLKIVFFINKENKEHVSGSTNVTFNKSTCIISNFHCAMFKYLHEMKFHFLVCFNLNYEITILKQVFIFTLIQIML